jgi:DNA polymerase-3 subunit delta
MIITITGDNHYQVRAEARAIISGFITEHGSFSVERFAAAEAETEHILSAISGGSLLSPRKLVVIEDFETSKELVDKTEQLVAETPDTTTVLIIINKLDKRTTYGKLLKKASDFREYTTLSPQETTAWIVQTAQEKGGQIDRPTAQYLMEYVGTSGELLANELDKLILLDPHITRATIDQLSERQPSSTVFELLDAGFNGHQKRALQLYDEQRRQQMEPTGIIGMIGWQLHTLALLKTAKDKAPADIAKDAGIHPFVVQKSVKLAQRMSLTKLKQLVHHAVVLEEQLKNRTMNADDAVKHYILSLSTTS